MKQANHQNKWDAMAFMKIHVSESEDRECRDCFESKQFCENHSQDENYQWDKPIMGILQYESSSRGKFDRKIFAHSNFGLDESLKVSNNVYNEDYLHPAISTSIDRNKNAQAPSFQPKSLFEKKNPDIIEEMLQTILSKSWRNTTILSEEGSDLVRLQ